MLIEICFSIEKYKQALFIMFDPSDYLELEIGEINFYCEIVIQQTQDMECVVCPWYFEYVNYKFNSRLSEFNGIIGDNLKTALCCFTTKKP